MIVPVKIPSYTEILVKVGQRVDFTTPLLRRSTKKKAIIPIAEMMGFPSEEIFHHIKKTIGEQISKGDLLAEQKNVFSSKKYLSQIDGLLSEIDHTAGTLIIEQSSNGSEEIACFFSGEIEGVYDGYLDLKVHHAHKVDLSHPVSYFGSRIYYAPDSGTSFQEEDIEGKCILIQDLNPMHSTKIEALGGQGLISKKKIALKSSLVQIIPQQEADFDMLLKKRFPFLIAGPEDCTLYFYES